MIRLIRVVIIIIIIAIPLTYVVAYASPNIIINRLCPLITERLIGVHKAPITQGQGGPLTPEQQERAEEEVELDYRYDAFVHFSSSTVEVRDLYIRSHRMRLGSEEFLQAHLAIDRVEIELVPLLRDNEFNIVEAEGRKFLGLLTPDFLRKYLEMANPGVEDMVITQYDGRCVIRGIFGVVSAATQTTIIGDWEIDDRGVIVLANRRYYNVYGAVPGGVGNIIEQEYTFEIRLDILGDEMHGEAVFWDEESGALWVSVNDEPPE